MNFRPATQSAVDFSRSSCTWLLRDQDSWGRFALDAVLTIGMRDAPTERYVLTAQVLAGNVYAGEKLFKDPPYGYSAAFSATKFRIFRDPVRGAAGGGDSWGPHGDQFREIRVDLREAACRAVRPGALIGDAGTAGSPLSARIDLPAGPGQPRHALEFPVRHINLDTAAKRFQVETGPVLALEDGEGDALQRLRRAYVNFGALDRAEFLVDAPRDAGAQGSWARTTSRACSVALLCAA